MKIEEIEIKVKYDYANLVCDILVTILGLSFYFYFVPYQIDESFSALSVIGPKTFPSIFSMALIVLGSILTIKNYKLLKTEQSIQPGVLLHTSLKEVTFSGIAIVIAILGVVYTALLEYAGYIIINTIAVAIFYYMFGGKSWWKGLLLGIVVSLSLWLFFSTYLQLAIPAGVFLGG